MTNIFENKNIILGITGSIAAYKACYLARLLVTAKANVHVLMTKSATQFVGKTTLEALVHHKVLVDIFDESDDISHISLTDNCDLFIVAPASANSIAKFASGMADNSLCASILACPAPILIAPAMNTRMYNNQATVDNINTLKRRGFLFIHPASGDLACGHIGEGRMAEPEDIFKYAKAILDNEFEAIGYNCPKLSSTKTQLLDSQKLLANKPNYNYKVMITAGPTIEPIDPVRVITNKSSGKMGYALAKNALLYGAKVILISGPTNLEIPEGVEFISVQSADDMLKAVKDNIKDCDIFIGTAAVADYKVAKANKQKIKKTSDNQELILKLVKNVDIISTIGNLKKNRPYTVGFAAETNNTVKYAKDKLKSKNLDLIVLNDVSKKDIGFDSNENEVDIFDNKGSHIHFDKQNKLQLAEHIMQIVFENTKEYKSKR